MIFPQNFYSLSKADDFQVSSSRQKLLRVFIGTRLKWYQTALCDNLSIVSAVHERMAIKRYYQVTNFLAYLQLEFTDWMSERFLKSVWNALDLLGACTQS